MKPILFSFICILISCANNNDKSSIPEKSKNIKLEEKIVGVWQLFRKNYNHNEDLFLVRDLEYLEIKGDHTFQDQRKKGVWYLSYTEDKPVVPNTQAIFTELFNLEPSYYQEYRRESSPFFIEFKNEKGQEYLFLHSIHSSSTNVYLRKE